MSGNISKDVKSETKSALTYTMGCLHMSVLDELEEKKHIKYINAVGENFEESYVNLEAVLKPVDFFSIIEVIKNLAPPLFQVMKKLGPKINPKFFTNKWIKELQDYENAVTVIVNQLENDYLKSKQLEMIMVDPNDPNIQFGIVDLDVSDCNPIEVKARLTDGKFHVIGKITRSVSEKQNISLVQRSFLSTVVDLVTKLVELDKEVEAIKKHKDDVEKVRSMIEKICQLQIPGPAYRLMAMSVCV